MKRVVTVLALLVMAVPITAWANSDTVLNKNGTILISGMAGTGGLGTLGLSAISFAGSGSQMTSFGGINGMLGRVTFATGALLSGSISGGGVFSSTGSIFDIIGTGKWMKGLTPPTSGKVTLFAGVFEGPIDWTMTGSGKKETFTLSGEVTGKLYNGQTYTGWTTQNFYSNKGQLTLGKAYLSTGSTQISPTPEPGTLLLLGTGLVGLAGVFRRKLLRP